MTEWKCRWREVQRAAGPSREFRCIRCGRLVPVSETLTPSELRQTCTDALKTDLVREVMET